MHVSLYLSHYVFVSKNVFGRTAPPTSVFIKKQLPSRKKLIKKYKFMRSRSTKLVNLPKFTFLMELIKRCSTNSSLKLVKIIHHSLHNVYQFIILIVVCNLYHADVWSHSQRTIYMCGARNNQSLMA